MNIQTDLMFLEKVLFYQKVMHSYSVETIFLIKRGLPFKKRL